MDFSAPRSPEYNSLAKLEISADVLCKTLLFFKTEFFCGYEF